MPATEATLQTANQAVGGPGLGKAVPAARENKAPALSGELRAVAEATSKAKLRKTHSVARGGGGRNRTLRSLIQKRGSWGP